MTTKRETGPRTEEIIAYSILIIAGAIPVSIALRKGGDFGVEPTIGIILISLGILGFVITLAHRRPRP
ncbi:MAG: hypothetical protein JWO36_7558 [Myxococcales bacterium]|nr:hypothetical protein [Myxococcales bacterium]